MATVDLDGVRVDVDIWRMEDLTIASDARDLVARRAALVALGESGGGRS
jgi:hypothetical protein